MSDAGRNAGDGERGRRGAAGPAPAKSAAGRAARSWRAAVVAAVAVGAVGGAARARASARPRVGRSRAVQRRTTGGPSRYAETGGQAAAVRSVGASRERAGDEPSADGAGRAPADGGDRQGPRRIMTPVDAALEILRGQAPGRGVHVRQIADAAARRRLVHGEPNEAWRVMRTALAAEPRERLRAGLRPRVRSAGRGSVRAGAPSARRGAGTRRAGVRRGASRAARADARGAGTAHRRAAGVGVRGAGARAAAARGVRPGDVRQARRGHDLRRGAARPRGAPVEVPGRAAVRSGVRRAQRPSASCAPASGRAVRTRGCSCWPGGWRRTPSPSGRSRAPPIEIADGPAMAETCIRHGVGVINTMVSVDFVDADFFADIAEG